MPLMCSVGQASQVKPRCGLHSRRKPFARHGFTLIELLVVISIIALLVGILLPALGAARRSAQNIKCASNLRQLGIGFMGYATDNGGKFPLNLPMPNWHTWWYQNDVIGAYIPGDAVDNANSIGGLSMACPSDIDIAARSYTMNYWASSDPNLPIDQAKKMWDAGAPNQSQLILAVESWSLYETAGLLYSRAWMGGGALTPYQAFVDFPETVLPPHRGLTFSNQPENRLDFNRHNDTGTNYDSRGNANFLYADGHVSLKSDDVLVDRIAGISTYDSLWTPIDRKLE